MDIERIVRHFFSSPFAVKRVFPSGALSAIEHAIKNSEEHHCGQICVVIEGALDFPLVLKGLSAHARALDIFSRQKIWDTEHNNGVLIYLLLADKNVEIVADRGVHSRVTSEGWEQICKGMEADFKNGQFERGILDGIRAVARHLKIHFPSRPQTNELPDRPVLL